MSVDGGTEGSLEDLLGFPNNINKTDVTMSEVLNLLEKRCLILMMTKNYDKAVQVAQEILRHKSGHALAYRLLLASLCKSNQLDRAMEVLKGWKQESPNDLDMLECRTKLQGLMEAVARGIDSRSAFSNLEEILGLNYDWLMKKRAESCWKYRSLPPGRNAFVLCLQHRFGHCSLGQKCPDAHGEHELEEWKQRTSFENGLTPAVPAPARGSVVVQRLLDKITYAGHESLILTENDNFGGVRIKCAEPQNTIVSSTKVTNCVWQFAVESKQPLLSVCLLYETYRQYFRISSAYFHGSGGKMDLKRADDENLQVVEVNLGASGSQNYTYSVEILFGRELFGNFRQTVVFDFGFEPIPARTLTVEVLPPSEEENEDTEDAGVNGHYNPSSVEDETRLTRKKGTWNFGNAEIVNGGNGDRVPSEKLGFALINGVVKSSSASDAKEVLRRENYKEKMRFFLTEEERARQEIISKYNLSALLHISDFYQMTSGFFEGESKYAVDGGLFGRMTLFRDVSEDTAVGRLILRSCKSVLLTKTEVVQNTQGKPRVYWCEISDKTKNAIYIQLGAFCVNDLSLTKEDVIMFDIQFQLDRTAFMEQKEVIDRLTDVHLDMLFPNFEQHYKIPWSPLMQWDGTEKLATRKLNPKQKEALIAVSHQGTKIPPILLIGPFGTGKTFTLAQCIRKILQQPDSRIMICTQSNSAADLYIKEYLHCWVKEGFEAAKALRIFYALRSFKTVHPIVLNYSMIEGGRFKNPTKEDILNHRVVVVTLGSSYLLKDLGLPPDTFSHIFLDEAAQAMESEAVTPLLSAGENTILVLAGDHMQLSPELFWENAKNFHSSLLERLHCLYPDSHPCKLMLCENYRSHAAIIQFASESFYNRKLECGMGQPIHECIYPLSFFAARGEDVQEQDSTSYFNMAEVFEIAEKVSDIIASWPESWGDYRDESAIGVLTPYADQVSKIRARLRKKGLTHVSVERVLNVQGKQFRVVLLSTVRTHKPWVRILPEAVGKEVDFGFFSNPKLLNTALTRAQSLVAVVGDPVSLCSVGKCRVLWEDFIRVCHENRSLHGISYTQIKQNILGVEMRNTWGLNPLANEFKPKGSMSNQTTSMESSSATALSQKYLAKPCVPSPSTQYTQPKHSPLPHETPAVTSPQQFGVRSTAGAVPAPTQSVNSQYVNGIPPSHVPTYPAVPPYDFGYRQRVPVPIPSQPVVMPPFGLPQTFPPYNSNPAVVPPRFPNIMVPTNPLNPYVAVQHPSVRFFRPGFEQPALSPIPQPPAINTAAVTATPQVLGPSPYFVSPASDTNTHNHVRKDFAPAAQSYANQQPSSFSSDNSRQPFVNAQHAAGAPLFRRGMEGSSSSSSNVNPYASNQLEQKLAISASKLPLNSLDKMSNDDIQMLQEVFEIYSLSDDGLSNEDKLKTLRTKLGLPVSDAFKFASAAMASGNNSSVGLPDLNSLDHQLLRNSSSLDNPNPMACESTNGINSNSIAFTNTRGTAPSYLPNSTSLGSSQQNIWFSNPTNYMTSFNHDRPSSNNPSVTSTINLQGYSNNAQTYRINQSYLSGLSLHATETMRPANFASVPDSRSHPHSQPVSAAGGNVKSYANIVKQGTSAASPSINNNSSQDSDSQQNVVKLHMLPKSQAQSNIRTTKTSLPGNDYNFANSAMARKSQR